MPTSHGPTNVIVIRDGHDVHATVEDIHHTPWSPVVISERGQRRTEVDWEVIISFAGKGEGPPSIFVFESRETARQWAKDDKRARGFDWGFLNEPDHDRGKQKGGQSQARASTSAGGGRSFTLYGVDAGTRSAYDVPATGVSDWQTQDPIGVPNWRPDSFSCSAGCNMTGHADGELKQAQIFAPTGDQAGNLPFMYLDSAYY
jgi:hypothetical protein